MLRSFCLIAALLLLVNVAFAQDNAEGVWRANEDDSIEYNCETLQSVLTALNESDFQAISELGEEAIVRVEDGEEGSVNTYISTAVLAILAADADATITLNDVFASASAVCSEDTTTATTSADFETFNVIVNGDVNLRSCAGTNCDIVQKAANNSLLTVVGVEGDWYLVQLDDGTAYIASWLTTPGPDEIIQVDESYTDEKTGCLVVFDIERGDMDMNLILTGDRQGDVFVDLYRPNETNPLRVEGQLDKTFIDTGDTYIHQYYRFNVSWPQGVYQLEITLDDNTSRLAWELVDRGGYNIFVVCD